MRLVFLGSPEPVLPVLQTLFEQAQSRGHELVGVVSQPAKPAGRSGKVQDPPVAQWAKEHGILTLQPESAKDPEFLKALQALAPDVMITAAYGQILSDAFLQIPRRGTINIHPSLIPAYRGATPVQAALLNGDHTSGVTILFTVKKLDAGAVICQERFEVAPDETSEQLLPRLFAEGANMLFGALDKLKDPAFVGTVQDETLVTHCRKIAKEDGLVVWNDASAEIYNRFRAYQPWPGTYTFLGEKRVAILEMSLPKPDQTRAGRMHAPGSLMFNKALKALEVATKDGSVLISKVLPAGGKAQDAAAFWNGIKIKEGAQFGVQTGG